MRGRGRETGTEAPTRIKNREIPLTKKEIKRELGKSLGNWGGPGRLVGKVLLCSGNECR